MGAVDPTGRVLVPVGNADARKEVLSAVQQTLREVGAVNEANQLMLEERDGLQIITAGGADLTESSNPSAQLVGATINTNDKIAIDLTDASLDSVSGARTMTAVSRDDPSLILIELNDDTIANLILPATVQSGPLQGSVVGMSTTFGTALIHELGHAFGYFAENQVRFPVFGQTNDSALRAENAHRRLLAKGLLPLVQRRDH
jgi:hypothetical protein